MHLVAPIFAPYFYALFVQKSAKSLANAILSRAKTGGGRIGAKRIYPNRNGSGKENRQSASFGVEP